MPDDFVDYDNDDRWDDEFKIDPDPLNDVMLTGAQTWTDAQIENYKRNKRKQNIVGLIRYVRKQRYEKEQADKARQKNISELIWGVLQEGAKWIAIALLAYLFAKGA